MKRRVVITGMGAVSPIGNNVSQMWNNAKAGVNGIDTITSFDISNFKVTLAAQVKDLNPEDFIPKSDLKRYSRYTQFALIAAQEAMTQSGLDISKEDATRCGTMISSGIGGIDNIQQEHLRAQEKGFERVSPFFIPAAISNMASGVVAIAHGLKGKCTCVVTACAGGTNAIGDAFQHIRDGYSDVMVCGGAEAAITSLSIGGFSTLRALSTSKDKNRASIPFDKERNGFVMGEGAGILVLEDYQHAISRNATILAEVLGYGSNCDAYHMTAPDPSGESAARCIRDALTDGGLTPEEVNYINAHGTSTPLNDKGETQAIKLALGEKHASSIPISSTKSMTGHLLGAAGAIELIFAVKSIEQQFAPPTINYQVEDPDCDLDIVPNQGKECKISVALSNSLGFGGHNATLAVGKLRS